MYKAPPNYFEFARVFCVLVCDVIKELPATIVFTLGAYQFTNHVSPGISSWLYGIVMLYRWLRLFFFFFHCNHERIKGDSVGFGDSFCRTVWGICLSWFCIDFFFFLATKLIGPRMGRQFFKNLDFSSSPQSPCCQVFLHGWCRLWR